MRALVADDERTTIAILTKALQGCHVEPIVAHDGRAAWDVLSGSKPPALAIVDWMMPGLDGLQVCRALRADADPRLAEIPVVLITGRSDATDTAAGFDAGVTDYLTKPFKPSVLLARLHAWLLRSGTARGAGSPPTAPSR